MKENSTQLFHWSYKNLSGFWSLEQHKGGQDAAQNCHNYCNSLAFGAHIYSGSSEEINYNSTGVCDSKVMALKIQPSTKYLKIFLVSF